MTYTSLEVSLETATHRPWRQDRRLRLRPRRDLVGDGRRRVEDGDRELVLVDDTVSGWSWNPSVAPAAAGGEQGGYR